MFSQQTLTQNEENNAVQFFREPPFWQRKRRKELCKLCSCRNFEICLTSTQSLWSCFLGNSSSKGETKDLYYFQKKSEISRREVPSEKKAFHLNEVFFVSRPLFLLFESSAKIQNGGSDVDAARFSIDKKSDKLRR